MAKVSICIPAYNNTEAVHRLLTSIKAQDYTDYEVVITDDSTGDEIDSLARKMGNIRYYKNKVRLGATANWNEAVGKCTGEYIKIMHHDDWFTDKGSLAEMVRLLDMHPEADIAFCGTRQVEEGKSHDRYTSDKEAEEIEADYRNLFLGNTIGAPSATIYRNLAGVYDENLTWLVDMDFYMAVLKKNPHFCYTKEPLISIGVGRNQLTEQCIGNALINIREYGYIYKKYDLSGNGKYRDKLLGILMDNEASFSQANEQGITGTEYYKARVRKLISKIKWKLGIGR